MDLSSYSAGGFDRGKGRLTEAMWILVKQLFFSSALPGSRLRVLLLRLFGARIGKNVVIKERVIIKFPWKLEVGDNTWIGEGVWIDNLADVKIGSNCCLSQGVYLCTGNHRWDKKSFDLIVEPIFVADKSWVGAQSLVAPGVSIREGAVVSMGSRIVKDTDSWVVIRSQANEKVKPRKILN